MSATGASTRSATGSANRPALEAAAGVLGTLWHWSSVVSLLAIVPVAHLLAVHGTGDPTGAVFGASFAVFALLLPAVALLRDYIDRRTNRLQEVLRQRAIAQDNARQADDVSNEILTAQRTMFERLAKAVAPLQRGIALTIIATVASSAALIASSSTLRKHALTWLVFSVADLLTALALVCLVGAVASMLPFTWHLLIRSEQINQVTNAINIELNPPATPKPEPPPTGTGGAASSL